MPFCFTQHLCRPAQVPKGVEISVKFTEWVERPSDDAAAMRIAEELHLHLPTARVLSNRGYRDPESARRFLEKQLDVLFDPYEMKDMDRAVRALDETIEAGKRITVYGDYDVDGVTAVSVLVRFLTDAGADVGYYIPNRETEGYGLHCEAIDKIAADGTALIVTVDTGVAAYEEAEHVYRCGMKLLVTDHHQCIEPLPRAEAVIDPRRHDETYPFCELAGVGVAFKLACAFAVRRLKGAPEKRMVTAGLCKRYAELVALGTVADVMPLTEENRLFVNLGLSMMQAPKNPGLAALIRETDLQRAGGKPRRDRRYTTSYISYSLAPRINAIGRVGSALTAARLFLTEDEEEAASLAAELCLANAERQAQESEIFEQACEKVRREHDLSRETVLVLGDDRWQPGVIGIVASRITEKYGRPSFLVSFRDAQEGVGRGSGRSVTGFDLFAALTHCADVLERFGGHTMAAGISVSRDRLAAFSEQINRYAEENLSEGLPRGVRLIDCRLDPSEVTVELAEELTLLEPFGEGNPAPLFCSEDVRLTEVLPIGEGKHTRLRIRLDETVLDGVWFQHAPEQLPFAGGDEADLLYQVEVNEYGGRRSAQIQVSDARPGTDARERLNEQRKRYRAFCAGEDASFPAPGRETYAALFRMIRDETPSDLSVPTVSRRLGIGIDTLFAALDVLSEAELIVRTPVDDDTVRCAATVQKSAGKKDLSKTPTGIRLEHAEKSAE